MKRSLLAILVLSANLFLIGCADDQARAQLADTNARLAQMQQNVNVLDSKIANQKLLDILNKLDDLQNQINQLNGDVVALKQNQATQEQLNQSIQDQIQSLGGHVTTPNANSSPSVASGAAASNTNSADEESEADNDTRLSLAVKNLKEHHFTTAIKQLKSIISGSKNSSVTADASYYLTVAYAASGAYKDAIIQGRKFVHDNPGSSNAPDALQTVFIAQQQLGMKKSAKNTAKMLIKNYPDSGAAKKVKPQI